jgi:hypothetical protein
MFCPFILIVVLVFRLITVGLFRQHHSLVGLRARFTNLHKSCLSGLGLQKDADKHRSWRAGPVRCAQRALILCELAPQIAVSHHFLSSPSPSFVRLESRHRRLRSSESAVSGHSKPATLREALRIGQPRLLLSAMNELNVNLQHSILTLAGNGWSKPADCA